MKVLITGSAGFIGFHLTKALLLRGVEVVGIDNINDYYSPALKFARLAETGITRPIEWFEPSQSTSYNNYRFIRMNLEDKKQLLELCLEERFDVVVNLAAQAGVRYSIENPDVYVQSNVVGFLNILEACRYTGIKHLVYASSSSVYGMNETMPFSESQHADHPISLYAATKKANELMAHSYSHLFGLPTTGLRFFTVYGPWGRPDMAYFLFTDAITNGKPIKVFNRGKMKRDFTYIDDVVNGIIEVINRPQVPKAGWSGKNPDPSASSAPYRIFNIGNNQPVELGCFIKEIEKNLGIDAVMELMDIQDGDVTATWADIDALMNDTSYEPSTSIEEGLREFVNWYKAFYKIDEHMMAGTF